MKESAVEFFGLPLESKNAVAFQGDGDKFQGFGHHFSGGPSAGKLDWAECVLLVTQPAQGRKTELWPATPPSFRSVCVTACVHVHYYYIYICIVSSFRPVSSFNNCLALPNDLLHAPWIPNRDALDKYSTEMTGLARRLLGFMATDLGVSPEALLGAFFSGDAEKGQSMGMHYYPPCCHPEKVLGIPPHTDGLALTVLLHADDTPGLQIRRGNRWFPVRQLPGAFVVNVGDILEVLTNGAYASVEHRVVPDSERGRTTVVVFQDASVDGMVRPLPELLGEDEARARYNSIEKLEYTKGNFRAMGEGTRFLDSLKKN
jgi:isopenicillin N synthase-like dioxygenase